MFRSRFWCWSGGCWCSCGRCGAACIAHPGEDGTDLNGLTFRDQDLGHHTRDGRWHLGIDLVGRHLEQRLVLGNGVTHLLEPTRNRSFGDRLTEHGKRYIAHGFLLNLCN